MIIDGRTIDPGSVIEADICIAGGGAAGMTLAKELSTGTFETVVGEVKLEDNQLRDLWWVGQWQRGSFRAVDPEGKAGASAPVIPKPEW